MIDDSGFIIMHFDWLDLKDRKEAYHKHLVQKEPAIVERLIQEGLMQQLGCINYAQLFNQTTLLVPYL
jgi:hypothetical protein